MLALPIVESTTLAADLPMDELGEITQQLLRFSPDALIVVDDRGRIRFASETVTELFGYPPAALVGQPMDMLVPERMRSRHTEHVSNFLAKPSNREMGARLADLAARRADGSEFSAGIRLAPFKIGDKVFVAAAIRDVTERQRINEALVAAREEADRANRAKSRFLATASHDLRQPLQTIRLLNASLLRIVEAPDSRDLLLQQANAIDTMTRLLNALLDISRLESGAVEPRPAPIPLAEIFAELRAEFETAARSHGLLLKFDSTAAVVSTDRILFYQMLQNLVGNAVKYTDRGTVGVTCALGDDGLTITIQDTGVGIPADKLERIFDEYYQVDTHGAKRMGVGLGLAIVKEVARILDVTVRVSSRVGEGTQARVTIPSKYLLSSSPELPAEQRAGARAASSARARLILVEDNDSVRTATELFLQLEGYETRSAGSVAAAEKLFETMERGEIVIADYHLDARNTGLEMLMQLRARAGYEVPGIVLSGDLPSVLRSVKAAVPRCVFLSKPVDTIALIDSIEQLNSSMRQQQGVAGHLPRSQSS
jgi:PAS domain S-box-containing protein